MVMKATTPPTMPMMTESMLASPVDCLVWGRWVAEVTGLRLVELGCSQMISSSDWVVVREVEYVTSMVVVEVPSQVSSALLSPTRLRPARRSGAEQRTAARSE